MLKNSYITILFTSSLLFLSTNIVGEGGVSTTASNTIPAVSEMKNDNIIVTIVERTISEPNIEIISLADTVNRNPVLATNDELRSSAKGMESRIGELMVLDNLFDQETQVSSSDFTSLGDLFVLNALFNQGRIGSPENQYSLGDLFVLDQLFNYTESDLLDHDTSSLGDLFILDKLFSQ